MMPRFHLPGDRKGTVTVLTSLAMVTLLCFTGLVVDVGDIFDAHRRLQGANDIAAMAAASNLSTAGTAANAAAADNGYAAAAVTGVTTGIYTPNPALPPAQRFVAGPAATANAALVTMSNSQPLFFNGAFNLAGNGSNPQIPNAAQIGTQSMAVNAVSASFTMGSALATLNGGLINSVLSGMVGGNVSLSAMDYSNLLGTQIDLFQFSQALATELGVTGVTYQQLFSSTITLGQFIQALQLAGANTQAASALGAIEAAGGGNTQSFSLSQLVNFGPFQYYQVGAAEPMSAGLPAYQLLSLAGQLAGGGHQIALAIGADVPGLSNVQGTLTIGEPPVGSSMISVGSTGTSVHTAQTRLLLTANVGMIGIATVRLPLYMELASATATMSAMSCNMLDPGNSSVTISATPAVADLWVGNVSPADMVNYGVEPTPAPAQLVSLLNITNIVGYANAPMSNMQPSNLTFTYNEIQNDTMQSTSTQDEFATLFAALLGRISLTANVAGVSVAVPPGTLGLLQSVFGLAATPLDQLVTGVLQTVGVSLGVADVWVNGDHCAPAMLAQ